MKNLPRKYGNSKETDSQASAMLHKIIFIINDEELRDAEKTSERIRDFFFPLSLSRSLGLSLQKSVEGNFNHATKVNKCMAGASCPRACALSLPPSLSQ